MSLFPDRKSPMKIPRPFAPSPRLVDLYLFTVLLHNRKRISFPLWTL